METVKCNLCGSDNHRVVYSMPDARYFVDEWFSVVECSHCGLGFVNPRPTRGEISKYYPPSFYNYFDAEEKEHQRRYAVEARLLEEMTSEDQRSLLDVGCANGDFPRFMKRLGWKVEGVEVSGNARAVNDFKIYPHEFKEIPVNDPSYDVVTAWAVLEHTHDPMGSFRKAAQILKQGGLFVFLVTNFKSVSSRGLFVEDIPRHLYFFSEETVKRYLSLTGFELIKRDHSKKIYTMHPVNFLRYYFLRYFRERKLTWQETRFKKSGGHGRMICRLKFLISNPFYAIDRLLMPIYERYQIISKAYGITTYVARRR